MGELKEMKCYLLLKIASYVRLSLIRQLNGYLKGRKAKVCQVEQAEQLDWNHGRMRLWWIELDGYYGGIVDFVACQSSVQAVVEDEA